MSKREEWISRTKKIVLASPETKITSFKPKLMAIGIEPGPKDQPYYRRKDPEVYVSEIEQKDIRLDQISIRVVVNYILLSSPNNWMTRHADIKDGVLEYYFWPPHEDYRDTPLIYTDIEGRLRPARLP